jgi:hypothetical protein
MTTAHRLVAGGKELDGVAPNQGGRPTIKSKAVLDEIYMRLCDGESLRKICRAAHMPARSVVFDWLKKDPDFRRLYELGRSLQLEGLADDIIDIADNGTQDCIERKGPNGTTVVRVDHDRIKRDRLRIDGRKWMVSRLLPKKYGKHALGLYQEIADTSSRAEASSGARKEALDAALARWSNFGPPSKEKG